MRNKRSLWKRFLKLLGSSSPTSRRQTVQAHPSVEALETRLVPSTFVWNKTAMLPVWSDKANWLVGGMEPAAAPTTNDTVQFNAGNVASTDNIASLQLQDFTVSGYSGTITLTQTLSVSGTFTLDAGATVSTGANKVQVGTSTSTPGSFDWKGGTFSGTLWLGTTTIAGTTGTIETTTANKTLDGGTIRNYGTLTWSTATGNGDIDMKNTSILNNYGTFTISGTGDANITNSAGVPGTINNQSAATFTKSGGVSSTISMNVTFMNQGGTLEADAGTMSFNWSVTQSSGTTNLNSGTIALAAARTLIVSGGTLSGVGTVDGPVDVKSDGALTPGLSGAPGRLNITGNLEMESGSTMNINVNNSAIALAYVEGTVTLDSGCILNAFPASGYSATSGTLTFLDGYTGLTGSFSSGNLGSQVWLVGSTYYDFVLSGVNTLTIEQYG